MVPTSHHTLRISSARNPSGMIDSEASTGNHYPVITESMPTPGVEPKSFKLPPLARPQLLTKSSTRTLLDLPNRRSSNDSGFRTNSSCAGSEIDSPTSHAAISRLNSDRSLVVTNSQAVIIASDLPYMEEVESVMFLDSKTEEDKNLFIRRRSFSDIPNRIHCSAPSLHTTTACSNSEEKNDSKEETPEKSEDVEEGGESGEQDQKEEEEEEEGIVHIIPPKGWVKRIFYILFLPLIILLFFTLPDIKKPVSLDYLVAPCFLMQVTLSIHYKILSTYIHTALSVSFSNRILWKCAVDWCLFLLHGLVGHGIWRYC